VDEGDGKPIDNAPLGKAEAEEEAETDADATAATAVAGPADDEDDGEVIVLALVNGLNENAEFVLGNPIVVAPLTFAFDADAAMACVREAALLDALLAKPCIAA